MMKGCRRGGTTCAPANTTTSNQLVLQKCNTRAYNCVGRFSAVFHAASLDHMMHKMPPIGTCFSLTPFGGIPRSTPSHREWLGAEGKGKEDTEGDKEAAEDDKGEGDVAVEGDGLPAQPPAPPRFLQYVAASPGQVRECTYLPRDSIVGCRRGIKLTLPLHGDTLPLHRVSSEGPLPRRGVPRTARGLVGYPSSAIGCYKGHAYFRQSNMMG